MNSKNDNKPINKWTWNNKNKTQNELNKQLEQEQNHRNGGHMEGYQQGSGRGRGGKVQRTGSMGGR